MLSHIKELVKEAVEGKYALGAFNVHNLETIIGVARAAEEAGSPAIIQVSESAIEYMGLKPVTHLVSTAAKNIAIHQPIALHLDHGKSLDVVFECINAGFSSVHIDLSHLPLDENISLSKQVVQVAHAKGIWVQGEVGSMVGGHGALGGELENIPIAKVEDVVNFVQETGVDAIAAAVGTAHGIYTNESINIPLIKDIKTRTMIPFVLHGGSGISDEDLKEAIKAGVNIVNIGTDVKIAFSKTLIKSCLENQQETDPRKLLKPTIEAVKEVVMGRMKALRSAGRFMKARMET
jgi:ketose-bisphosphate aldolase